ncbi:MAG TPA: O-antigen ligase family protein, partial [Vicinamibacterales bacterium]|nr:O-antigen ligase family protein [Vicinamibacterales bacterium]
MTALAVVVRPRVARRSTRWLDVPLALCLCVVAAQLVPLPIALHDRLSPNATAVAGAVALTAKEPTPRAPISIEPESTAWAFALGASYIVLFWCARAMFASGGVRLTIRSLTVLGLALTVLVGVQRATSPTLLYWTWKPLSAGASPYGPFVNRNGLAAWLAMAVPLAIGYVVARHRSPSTAGRPLTSAIAEIDATTILLAGSACLMTGCLLGSLSRSGIFAAGIGLTAFVLLSQARATAGRAVAAVTGGLAAMVAIGAMYANLGALAMRMQETTELGEWGRRVIWHDTIQMIRDFA